MAAVTHAADINDIEILLEELAFTRIRLDEAMKRSAAERQRAIACCSQLKHTITAVCHERRAGLFETPKAIEARKSLARLTAREREVLRLIAEGYSTKQIAGELNISFKTAVSHRSNILEKLGVHESATLVRLAITAGLVAA